MPSPPPPAEILGSVKTRGTVVSPRIAAAEGDNEITCFGVPPIAQGGVQDLG